jgi:hypothetical protein
MMGSAGFHDDEATEVTMQQDFRKSWIYVEEFYAELQQSISYGQKAGYLHRLVRQLANSIIAQRFRAGQSLWHLLISTTPYIRPYATFPT